MMGDHTKPIELYKKCVRIWSSLGMSVSMGTAYTYCQTGYEYYITKDYEKAYDNLIKGRELCIHLKLNNSFNFAYYMWYLACVFSDGFGDYCMAADYLKKSVEIFEKQKNTAATEAKNTLQVFQKKCSSGRARREKEERLVSAVMNDDMITVKKLIKDNVSINARVFINGASPLYSASYRGNLEMVKLLVENGADINIRMYRGFTPLMGALSMRQHGVVRYLLSRNASVNMADCRGETPLMHAVGSMTTQEIIELLIAKGADVNARNDNGESVLQKASSAAAKILRNYGAK
jgi:tetratricopeptide (TPR) repeat protein